jgi:hypothetical protein
MELAGVLAEVDASWLNESKPCSNLGVKTAEISIRKGQTRRPFYCFNFLFLSQSLASFHHSYQLKSILQIRVEQTYNENISPDTGEVERRLLAFTLRLLHHEISVRFRSGLGLRICFAVLLRLFVKSKRKHRKKALL